MPKQKPVLYLEKRPSGKRTVLFKAISILLPFLILFLLEISLRVFHYGHNLDLFMEFPGDQHYLVLNPDASKRYFTSQEMAPTGNRELFKKEKDKNTCRIFVLGESTTIGYPYFHNGSFHRWLQYRLMQTFPDRNFEIINLSMTAVNSYTVLGFAKELVDYEPDAVLIYSGQNEYYGAMGVGSTNKVAGNPRIIRLMLALRELRITQLITDLVKKITGSGQKKYTGETFMRLMVADQQILWQSKPYYRGIDQFRSNIEETLKLFCKRKIPVFISTIVSNEKDLRPFVSIGADSIRFPEFKKDYDLGVKAFESKDMAAAANWLGEANRIYGGHARCNFYLGQLTWLRGDFGSARRFFSRAKELDALRFRAPDSMNGIISELCKKYDNAHLVDTKTAFENASDNRIIGDELILEHVHPNLSGYALMADAFYETMKKYHLITLNKENEISFDQLVREMPITKVDSLAGAYTIGKLKRSWPFSDTTTREPIKIASREEQLAWELAFKKTRWTTAMDSLYSFYVDKGDFKNAKTVTEGMTLEYPEDASFYEKTAMLYGKLNDYKNAAFYYKKAFSLAPSPEKARYLFVLYFRLDRPADGMPYLEYSINNSGRGFTLQHIRALVGEIMDLQKKYSKDSADINIPNQIARKYLEMGNKDAAVKYIERVLKSDEKNEEALSLLAKMKK
ncbi:MAG TPA: hypothetical protein VK563_18230 [Puia sp.]|nr:hypothetical protein [Puia sp.]